MTRPLTPIQKAALEAIEEESVARQRFIDGGCVEWWPTGEPKLYRYVDVEGLCLVSPDGECGPDIEAAAFYDGSWIPVMHGDREVDQVPEVHRVVILGRLDARLPAFEIEHLLSENQRASIKARCEDAMVAYRRQQQADDIAEDYFARHVA